MINAQEPVILLDREAIASQLIGEQVSVTVLERTASTNDYLRSLPDKQHIQICIAEQQTKGKGRLNREWYSPFGKNIYLSCLYPFQKNINALSGLSLAISLAVVRVLKHHGIADKLVTKWPNDIIYENKKLSGSLIEMVNDTRGETHLIIGIGINVNMLEDALENNSHISQPWTSMQQILGVPVDRNQLCADVINELLVCLQRFCEQGFSVFRQEWLEMDSLMNQTVTISNVSTTLSGKVLGVDEYGHLQLRLQDGTVKTFSSGDTTIVK